MQHIGITLSGVCLCVCLSGSHTFLVVGTLGHFFSFQQVKYFFIDFKIGIYWEEMCKQNKNRSTIKKVILILIMGIDQQILTSISLYA